MVRTGIGVGSGSYDLREILLRGPEVWNHWREINLGAQIDLSKANLTGTNLSEANLSEADLSEADLSEADLSGADLSEANLRYADLSNANLSSAYLSVAKLREADLSNANLSSANLIGAYLIKADLSNAILDRADLSNAIFDRAILEGAILEGAILEGADLSNANLRYVDLRGANLIGANLSKADLSKAILDRAILEGAILEGAILEGAILSNAILEGAILRDVKLGFFNRVRYTFIIRRFPNRLFSIKSRIFQDFQVSVFDSDIRHSDIAQLQAAIDRYAKASGYEELTVISEKLGSWFKRIRYRIAKLISQDIQEEAIQAGQEFYRSGKSYALNKLEKTGVESTKQIAEATAEILKAVENLDDVVLLLGKLIVMKYTNDEGRSKTYVKTISSDLQLKLESTPQLLDSPQAIINFLKIQEELPPAIEEQKTLPATPEPLK